MRLAIASVGLVSPRSTWLSIGALTPERSARSRRLRPSASRSAFMRGPIVGVASTVAIQPYVIAYGASGVEALGGATEARGPDEARIARSPTVGERHATPREDADGRADRRVGRRVGHARAVDAREAAEMARDEADGGARDDAQRRRVREHLARQRRRDDEVDRLLGLPGHREVREHRVEVLAHRGARRRDAVGRDPDELGRAGALGEVGVLLGGVSRTPYARTAARKEWTSTQWTHSSVSTSSAL